MSTLMSTCLVMKVSMSILLAGKHCVCPRARQTFGLMPTLWQHPGTNLALFTPFKERRPFGSHGRKKWNHFNNCHFVLVVRNEARESHWGACWFLTLSYTHNSTVSWQPLIFFLRPLRDTTSREVLELSDLWTFDWRAWQRRYKTVQMTMIEKTKRWKNLVFACTVILLIVECRNVLLMLWHSCYFINHRGEGK